MTKKTNFKIILQKQFADWLVEQITMRKECGITKAVGTGEFDAWVGGWVSGYSLNKEPLNVKEIQEAVKALSKSKLAKICNVSGTKKEIYKIQEYK